MSYMMTDGLMEGHLSRAEAVEAVGADTIDLLDCRNVEHSGVLDNLQVYSASITAPDGRLVTVDYYLWPEQIAQYEQDETEMDCWDWDHHRGGYTID